MDGKKLKKKIAQGKLENKKRKSKLKGKKIEETGKETDEKATI